MTVQPIDVARVHTCVGIGQPLPHEAKRPLALDSGLLDPPQNVFEMKALTPGPPIIKRRTRPL